MSEITTVTSHAIKIVPVIVKSGWASYLVAGFIFGGPIIYLSFHGWASKNLIDTEKFDRLAKTLFVLSTLSMLMLYLITENYYARLSR